MESPKRYGYIFPTEQEAMDAVAVIDKHFSMPIENGTTSHYTMYQQWGDVWAIMALPELVDVLGEAVELPMMSVDGAYYRRSETINEEGLYTVESSISPTLSDGTVLTESNKDTYDGAEGWHWYDSGQVVDLKVTSTR